MSAVLLRIAPGSMAASGGWGKLARLTRLATLFVREASDIEARADALARRALEVRRRVLAGHGRTVPASGAGVVDHRSVSFSRGAA